MSFETCFVSDMTAKLKHLSYLTCSMTYDSERGGGGLQDMIGNLSHTRLFQGGFSSWL